MPNEIVVGNLEETSSIYGPGIRFVIWVQGCTLACKGCWNQQFWPLESETKYTVEELVEKIAATPNIEGITLLGGEPLQQVVPILELIEFVKSMELSVFLYTGYAKKEFTAEMWDCYNLSDIVVSGRYVESLRDTTMQWTGSSNQLVEFPTDRYQDIKQKHAREVEFHIVDGKLKIYGYPTELELGVNYDGN